MADNLPVRVEPTPEAVAELRAQMNPKRLLRTRLGIIFNGEVPIENATIDPTKSTTEAQDSASTSSTQTKEAANKPAPAKAAASSKPADSDKPD